MGEALTLGQHGQSDGYWAISQRHDWQNFHWRYLGDWRTECLNMWILHLQWEIAGNYIVSELNHKLSHYWSEHLEDIGQDQRSSHVTHLLMLVIICTKYRKNPSRIMNCRCYKADMIFKAKAKWLWRYRSSSKVTIRNMPSHTSDYLC